MSDENLKAVDAAFSDLMDEHDGLARKEVTDLMLVLRDFLRENYTVTGNGFGGGEADVSLKINGRHIWITIQDRTPETKQ